MKQEICRWSYNQELNVWCSDCGIAAHIDFDGPPSDNNMNYCYYCGKKIKEKLESWNDYLDSLFDYGCNSNLFEKFDTIFKENLKIKVKQL